MRTREEIIEKLFYAKGYRDAIKGYESTDVLDREIAVLEWMLSENEVKND